jgi:hypothetical protein
MSLDRNSRRFSQVLRDTAPAEAWSRLTVFGRSGGERSYNTILSASSSVILSLRRSRPLHDGEELGHAVPPAPVVAFTDPRGHEQSARNRHARRIGHLQFRLRG